MNACSQRFHKRLSALAPELHKGLRRGIEKESLRIHPDGRLADTPHPAGLGSALTHPKIITDFSEAQLELVTGVHASVGACLQELTQIHQVVYRQLGEEMLWCASMPCALPVDDEIPIAQYGSSNVGRAKTVYRRGLSYRYGRRMQTISGIHYNFSLSEAAWSLLHQCDGRNDPPRAHRTEAYFAAIRNFRRHSWLLLYLFGASPAVAASFAADRTHGLQELRPGTLYLPASTSLRMGPLGYQSDAQAALAVSYNSLEGYARSLYGALTEPYPRYAAVGLRDGEDYRQLATSLLQIENEFYGTIRPKRRIRTGERPLHALNQRGVEYIEVRCMDLDPFCSAGITAATMRFLDIFLLHCLLSDSAPDTPEEIATLARNQHRVALQGRDPNVRLARHGDELSLAQWGGQLLRECEPIAAALDIAHRGSAYGEAYTAAAAALRDPAATPSARMLRDMQFYDHSHLEFVLAQSRRHRNEMLELPLSPETHARYASMAEESLAVQRRIEARDAIPFETYRQRYLSQDLMASRRARSRN